MLLKATHIWGYFRRNHGTQHIVGLMTKVCYSERIYDRIIEGKRQILEKSMHRLPDTLSLP